ncbi:MFS transporter [Leucobacter sp. CSA1]|uniref:MFS transporter n=1 Tax=Leucobacter chromiisoli TaxID=2796471 RepID=A0A934Q9V2_9MICO|nr:MFS transporter [Leucobacter chromiisoli]MBK0419935.1 MFS transporter [Leucobacter chromiisoli]
MSATQIESRSPLTWGAGTVTFTVALVGYLTANLIPLMLLALENIGVPASEAGLMMTGNLLATAVASLLAAPLVAGRKRRVTARFGLLAAVIGFGAAALAPADGILLPAALVFAGLGAGAAAAAGGAALAAFQGSNRAAGFNMLFNRGSNAVLLALVPAVGLSMVSVFGAAAAVALVALAVTGFLPETPSESVEVAPVPGAVPVQNTRVVLSGFALLGLFAIWALSEDSLWAIAGTMGADQAGLDDALLGLVLSLSTIGGLAGAFVVVLLGPRFGRALPLALMLVVGGSLKFASTVATDAVAYAALLVAWNFIYGVAYTYFIATAAGLDARGRWSGPILGVYLIGSSFAPLFATWAVEVSGYQGFGWMIAGVSVLLVVPMIVIARISTKQEAVTGTPAAADPTA